jgi:hypothetical protein
MFRFNAQPANAILLSFLMMSMLVMATLGISFLVIRDVSTVRSLVGGSQALYAAEGMNELGLLLLKENLPGYEPELEDYEFSTNVLASLSVNARESSVPCSVQEEEWRALQPNESVQLALFAQDDESATNLTTIDQFYVEFFVGDEDGYVSYPSTADVLRWKILGINPSSGETEAISEFIPLLDSQNTEDNPSIFGSYVDRAEATGYSTAKFRQPGNPSTFYEAYPIDTFIQNHNYNYLVMTNVVQQSYENILYFRLTAMDSATKQATDAVCEYVSLSSSANKDYGSVRQSVNSIVKEGENLPFSDFVFYHTDNAEGSESETESSDGALTEIETPLIEEGFTAPFGL